MLLIKKQGFTLIELMVVIVIIGVLASLAIPRFTEASAKAKVAEAPRVLASFESAYLALRAESGEVNASNQDQLIFSPPGSKWFTYTTAVTGAEAAATGNIGKFSGNLVSEYVSGTNTDQDCFKHTATNSTEAKKMVPNFFGNGCSGSN
jgi:type IV pilus assembly protein PilA